MSAHDSSETGKVTLKENWNKGILRSQMNETLVDDEDKLILNSVFISIQIMCI